MSVILQAAIKLERIKQTIGLILADIANEERELFEQLNRAQLSNGQKADDIFLPNYVENSKTGKTGSINLFDTGDFYDSIEAIFDEEGFDLISTDPKHVFFAKYDTAGSSSLEGGVDLDVLGLNTKSRMIVAERIKQKLIKRVRDEITIRS